MTVFDCGTFQRFQSTRLIGSHLSLMQPYIPPGAIEAVSDTLRTRWIGEGPKVKEFERQFSEQLAGGRPAIAVGSCTDALHLAYVLAGIGPGDEVIAPLFTCTATNIPLIWLGAKIKFYDVEPNSLNGHLAAIAGMMTERTKAVVIVHYGGSRVPGDLRWLHPCLIEDCAQALGSHSPSWADYSCYSFQAVKHITTGDGGMLIVPREKAAEARRRRWFGIDREAKLAGTWANDITEVGYKYQMTDISAAMGIAGLGALDEQIGFRRKLLARYAQLLTTAQGVQLIDADPWGAAWLCTVLAERREDLMAKLIEHGIESGPTHYRNDRYSIFKEFRGEFPNMDAIEAKYLCLPLHMHMTIEDVERVCEVIASGW